MASPAALGIAILSTLSKTVAAGVDVKPAGSCDAVQCLETCPHAAANHLLKQKGICLHASRAPGTMWPLHCIHGWGGNELSPFACRGKQHASVRWQDLAELRLLSVHMLPGCWIVVMSSCALDHMHTFSMAKQCLNHLADFQFSGVGPLSLAPFHQSSAALQTAPLRLHFAQQYISYLGGSGPAQPGSCISLCESEKSQQQPVCH